MSAPVLKVLGVCDLTEDTNASADGAQTSATIFFFSFFFLLPKLS